METEQKKFLEKAVRIEIWSLFKCRAQMMYWIKAIYEETIYVAEKLDIWSM